MMGAVFLTNLMAVQIAGFIEPGRTIACGVALMIAGCILLIRLNIGEPFGACVRHLSCLVVALDCLCRH
jgi:hypothetical protein